MLANDPPPGVVAWPSDSESNHILAQVQGPQDSPYAKGIFKLEVTVPGRYPFEPPKVRFVTPIYHPNIDDGGRICLDTLKMPPQGSWSPSVNLSTLFTTIRVLMSHPNPDDGLMPDITELYRRDLAQFERKARASTELHATLNSLTSKELENAAGDGSSSSSSSSSSFAASHTSQRSEDSTDHSGSTDTSTTTSSVGASTTSLEKDADNGRSRESVEGSMKSTSVARSAQQATFGDEYEDEYVDEYEDEYEDEYVDEYIDNGAEESEIHDDKRQRTD